MINPTSFLFWPLDASVDGRRQRWSDDRAAAIHELDPPGSASYFSPAQVLATITRGATLDFITRDSSGAVADPDYFPAVPVVQAGAVTNTIVTLRRNAAGSYTATFPTPTGDESYYVPVTWTIGGNTYVQEFRVTVQSIDLPGKVLGGGSSTMTGPGVITDNPATQVNVTTENTTIRSS